MSIKDLLRPGIDEKLRSGEAKTEEEARAMVNAETKAKLSQLEERRLEKMVEDGQAGSVEEAREKEHAALTAAIEAIRSESGAFEAALDAMRADSSAFQAAVEAARAQEALLPRLRQELERMNATSFSPPNSLALERNMAEAIKVPPNPVPGLVSKVVDRLGDVEEAVNEVRLEQRIQGKRTRRLRTRLWCGGIIVTVLLGMLSSPLGDKLWAWLLGG